jgi:hypothetical protein
VRIAQEELTVSDGLFFFGLWGCRNVNVGLKLSDPSAKAGEFLLACGSCFPFAVHGGSL